MNILFLIMVLVYIVLTAFIEKGEAGGRVMLADLFVLLSMIVYFKLALFRREVKKANIYLMIVPLLLVFVIGGMFARDPETAISELIIILFLVFVSYFVTSIMMVSSVNRLKWFFSFYISALGLLSLVCVLDFMFFPGLISSRNLGGLQGPFSNTGQAGSFFGVHSAIALALLISGLVKKNIWNWAMLLCLVLALIFTLKRAATLGFAVGIVFMAIQLLFSTSASDKKIAIRAIAASFIGVPLLYFSFIWGLSGIAGMSERFERKFSSSVIQNLDEGFIAENVLNSIIAFSDSPLYGVGLGNVSGFYQYHEIHSTYFAVLAYGGMLGVLFYALFMISVLRIMYQEVKRRADNVFSKFLYYLFPMFLGLMISWGYTTHWRKREFWVLISFIFACSFVSKKLSDIRLSRQVVNE